MQSQIRVWLWFVQQVLAHEDSQSNPQLADELSKVSFRMCLRSQHLVGISSKICVKIHHEIWRDKHPRHRILIAGIGSFNPQSHLYVCG